MDQRRSWDRGDRASVPSDEDISRAETDASAFGRQNDDRTVDRPVIRLRLSDIDPKYLIRDRIGLDCDEMDSLVSSLRRRGQQTPIDVVDLGPDAAPRYGLISGWRRLQALKRIAEGGALSLSVLAILRHPEQASDAYLAMVEENEIRVGLSYYERARVTLKTVEQGVFPDIATALLALFHSSSRSKRSKIRSFISLVEALDGTLTFPEGIGERLGLALAKALDEDPDFARRLRQALDNSLAGDSAAEQEVIHRQLILQRRLYDDSPTASDSRRLGPGLAYTRYGNGNVLLSGPDLKAGLWHDLIDWLAARQLE